MFGPTRTPQHIKYIAKDLHNHYEIYPLHKNA